MNKFFSLTFLVVCTLAATEGSPLASNTTKLPFGFYITSQCGDTRNFITKQLYPTYQELNQYLNATFIPWGKTKRQEDGSLKCQFGESDCAANRLQLCALNKLGTDDSKMVEYINCEMTTLSSVSQNYTCVTQVGLSETTVKKCVDSTEGDNLEKIAEAKTNAITMIFVPTIVFNGTYDVDVQNAAFKDFKGYVCGLLKNENPKACN